MVRSIPLALLTAVVCLPSMAVAATYTIGPSDDLFATLASLQPGDEVIVEAGTYETGGFVAVSWVGTESEPIVVRAAEGARPVIQGVTDQNVLNVDGSWFTLSGFEITGGSHGLRLGNVDNAVFEDLVIHDVVDVGLSCNRPEHVCDRITLRDSEIYNTGTGGGPGEGLYIGCNNGDCTVSNSVFERNFIHDTASGEQGDGLEIKTGSWNNVVRDNVIINTKYPAITMYGYAGDHPPNVVEGNFVSTTVDNGIQIVGQVIVRNNIVVDAGLNGIHSKPSQGFAPDDAIIVHNTIVGASNACFKSNDWGGTGGQIVANNAFYCGDSQGIDFNGGAGTDTVIAGNLYLGSSNAPSGAQPGSDPNADLGDPAGWVFYPPVGSALIDAGDATHGTAVDFNGLPRDDDQPDVGAYEHSAAMNPGWAITDAPKALADPVEPGADGADTDSDTAVPGTDTMVPGTDTAVPGTDAMVADPSPQPVDVDDDAGCGCRLVHDAPPSPRSLPVAVLLGLVALVWRRRR